MTFFEWGPQYDLGVAQMNDEHKIIIGLMNRLWEQNAANASKETLISTLEKLRAYTTMHFADEERYMESISYPDIEPHRNIHKNILHRLDLFSVGYRRETSPAIPEDFFEFLKDWLSAHIRHVDRKYASRPQGK